MPRVRLHGAVRLRPAPLRDRVRRRREALPRRGAAARASTTRTRLIELDSEQVHPVRRAACASAARSSACRRTASSTAASAPWWRPRSAGRCSTPIACRAACASAPARPAPSRRSCRSRSPGPGRPSRPRAVCHYCGVGCRINYDTFGDTLVKVSRARTNEVTYGNHCRKGRFGYNYVHAADRLAAGRIRPGASCRSTPRSTRRSPTRRCG